LNTYQWYKERVYKLGEEYDTGNKLLAMEKSMEWGEKIPIGIFYKEDKPDFHDKVGFLKEGLPLVDREIDLKKYMNS